MSEIKQKNRKDIERQMVEFHLTAKANTELRELTERQDETIKDQRARLTEQTKELYRLARSAKTDSLRKAAPPAPFTFAFTLDSVRKIEINGVGPFLAGEAEDLLEFFELVRRALTRGATGQGGRTAR